MRNLLVHLKWSPTEHVDLHGAGELGEWKWAMVVIKEAAHVIMFYMPS